MLKTNRTSVGLRDTLFDELDNLRNGLITPHRAMAVAKTAAEIMGTVKLELAFHRFTNGIDPSDNGVTTKRDVPSLKLD